MKKMITIAALSMLISAPAWADDQSLLRHYNELQAALQTANSAFADVTTDLQGTMRELAQSKAQIKTLQEELAKAKAPAPRPKAPTPQPSGAKH